MTYSPPTRTATRQAPRLVLTGVAVVIVAVIGILIYHSAPSWESQLREVFSDGHKYDVSEADGGVSDDVTVFDTKVPAVANLDPSLLGALRRAAADAKDDGITFYVNSGWRSPKYQEELLREAISKYGSERAAARWVATPKTSLHVQGRAVDIGHPDAASWLSRHGARYGLCQIYRNEPWHYELRPQAASHGCPNMYADAAHDPRLQ